MAQLKKELRDGIDELAEIRAKMKPLEKREKELKVLLTPLGVGVHRGNKYYAVIEDGINSGFDSDLVRAANPEATWKAWWRQTPYIKISVKAATAKQSEAA
jgi:hypothetical protein